jgi:peptide/nickel transport system permease protein
VVLAALPEFVIGVAILLLVAVRLEWLPVDSTSVSLVGVPVAEKAKAFALPALAIALANAPYLIRMTRANTRDVVAEPYMRAAVLRGLRPVSLTFRHLLPNAAPPVVNSTAILLGSLVGGVVAIEAVFAFPGIGQLLVSAVQIRDIAVVQAWR